MGLFIIPAKKRQAKAELRGKIANLREQLTQSLRTQFEQEMERGMQNIKDTIAPYSRFVRAEQSKLEQVQNKLSETKIGLENLKVQVEEEIAKWVCDKCDISSLTHDWIGIIKIASQCDESEEFYGYIYFAINRT